MSDTNLQDTNVLYREILDSARDIGKADAKRAKTIKSIADELVNTVKLEAKIGTSNFQTADLTEEIIKAKREGNKEDEKKVKTRRKL